MNDTNEKSKLQSMPREVRQKWFESQIQAQQQHMRQRQQQQKMKQSQNKVQNNIGAVGAGGPNGQMSNQSAPTQPSKYLQKQSSANTNAENNNNHQHKPNESNIEYHLSQAEYLLQQQRQQTQTQTQVQSNVSVPNNNNTANTVTVNTSQPSNIPTQNVAVVSNHGYGQNYTVNNRGSFGVTNNNNKTSQAKICHNLSQQDIFKLQNAGYIIHCNNNQRGIYIVIPPQTYQIRQQQQQQQNAFYNSNAIMQPPKKRQKYSNDVSNEKEKIKLEKLNSKLEKEKKELEQSNSKLTKQMEKFKEQIKTLNDKINIYNGTSDSIKKDRLDLEQLNECEKALINGIQCISKSRERLIELKNKCIACRVNNKNIVFKDGCNHICICLECENKLNVKQCPLCRTKYTNARKMNL